MDPLSEREEFGLRLSKSAFALLMHDIQMGVLNADGSKRCKQFAHWPTLDCQLERHTSHIGSGREFQALLSGASH
jgi:hypothetical protein